MTLTREDAIELAEYARTRRQWNEAGSLAALRKVAHLDADEVAAAWHRFVADPGARHQGAFPNMKGPHWQAPTPPPRRDEIHPGCRCATCGLAEDACRERAPINAHHFESVTAREQRLEAERVDPATGELREPPRMTRARAQVREALAAAHANTDPNTEENTQPERNTA